MSLRAALDRVQKIPERLRGRCWRALWLLPHDWWSYFGYAHTSNEEVDLCERCGKMVYRPYVGGGTC